MAADILNPALCVIGAGVGGIEVAMAATRNGIDTVLIEKSLMGGQSLHTGCIPTQALIATAQRAYDMQSTRDLGISPAVPLVDFTALNRHLETTINALAENVTAARLEGMGIKVISAPARFVDDQTVEAGDYTIKAHNVVIATGSYPAAPIVKGINSVPYYTTDTIFSVTTRIDSLIIIGGTPYAVELAQAYGRLGTKVQLIEAGAFLPDLDMEATQLVRKTLALQNVVIHEGAELELVERSPNLGVKVTARLASGTKEFQANELLVAVGRIPNVDGIDIDRSGVGFDGDGIKVNKSLQTSNKRIFAIGDVLGSNQSASHAIAQARNLVQRLVSGVTVSFAPDQVAQIVRTDPQIAHIGLTEDRARDQHTNLEVRRFPLSESAHAQATRLSEGFIKVIVRSSGKLVGVTAVGHNAGELIAPWALAMKSNLSVEAVAGSHMAYPSPNQATSDVANTLTFGSVRNPWLRKTLNKLTGVR